MKISQEDPILIKNFYLPKQYGAQRLLSNLPDKGWKLGSIDSLLKRIRNQAAVDRVRRVAVEDIMLSDEDKPKRYRSARESSHETAILISHSSVHRIICGDFQLTCFKRHRAQLLSEAYCISRLTR